MPPERLCFDGIDVLDTGKVHIVPCTLVHNFFVVDRLGPQEAVIHELRCAPEERQEMIVVQAPNAVAACRLEPVRRLDRPHRLDILPENAQDNRFCVARQHKNPELY